MKAYFLVALFITSGCMKSDLTAQARLSETNPFNITYILSSTKVATPYFFNDEKNNYQTTAIQFFEVKRIKTKVELLWESEVNSDSSGYEVLRRTAGENWQRVAFVFPLPADSQNNERMTYEYTDVNVNKSETQYRLRILSRNNPNSFTEIRTIEGVDN